MLSQRFTCSCMREHTHGLAQDLKVHGHVRDVGEKNGIYINDDPDFEDGECHQVRHKIKGCQESLLATTGSLILMFGCRKRVMDIALTEYEKQSKNNTSTLTRGFNVNTRNGKPRRSTNP